MRLRSGHIKLVLAAMAIAGSTMPAQADTQLGKEAWSRGEYDIAVKEWRTAALAGDADAQFNLGQAYKLGRGVKTDLNVALDWYRRASAQGHLQATDTCGHLLHFQQKILEAIPFLIASSDRGEPRAQYLLATELFNGVYITKDWPRAYALMSRLAATGMASASRSLAQMDQYIPIEQRQAGTVIAAELEQRVNPTPPSQLAVSVIENSPATEKPAIIDVPPSPSPSPSPTTATLAPMAASNAKKSAKAVWRIQLGAFSKAENAQKLWKNDLNDVSEFAKMRPIFKKDGPLTLLQAGSFTSKAAADAVCKKVKASGQQCFAVSAY